MTLNGTVKSIDVGCRSWIEIHGLLKGFDKQQDTDIDEIITMSFLFFISL